jgi:hypothetical protein
MPALDFGLYPRSAAMLSGMRVVQSPLAERVTVRHEVRRHPIAKRRRNWTVVRIEARIPQAYAIGGHTLVIHPSLMSRLREFLS